eukprot:Pgem_evm1s19657
MKYYCDLVAKHRNNCTQRKPLKTFQYNENNYDCYDARSTCQSSEHPEMHINVVEGEDQCVNITHATIECTNTTHYFNSETFQCLSKSDHQSTTSNIIIASVVSTKTVIVLAFLGVWFWYQKQKKKTDLLN